MSEDDRKFPSQVAERFQIRMPDGLRDALRVAAASNNRSMNSEIISRLEGSFGTAPAADFGRADLQELVLVADRIRSGLRKLLVDKDRWEDLRRAKVLEAVLGMTAVANRARRAIWLAEFDRSEDLQKEFPTRESYAAFQEFENPEAFGEDWTINAVKAAMEGLAESVEQLGAAEPSEK